ncbi:MAG: hypothetical protein AABY22_28075, partial [Nanoarchaeota archaeon]
MPYREGDAIGFVGALLKKVKARKAAKDVERKRLDQESRAAKEKEEAAARVLEVAKKAREEAEKLRVADEEEDEAEMLFKRPLIDPILGGGEGSGAKKSGVVVGRLSHGFDESEFDAIPAEIEYMSETEPDWMTGAVAAKTPDWLAPPPRAPPTDLL